MNAFENPKNFVNITPSNTTIFTEPCALYIGNGGSLKITSAYSSGTCTFVNISSGTFLPVIVKKVWSTSTTCTNIIGLK